MNGWNSMELGWAASIAIKSGILLALALWARGWMRRTSAAHRHAVIAAALIAVLALPVVSLIAPRLIIAVPVNSRAVVAPPLVAAVTADAAPATTSPAKQMRKSTGQAATSLPITRSQHIPIKAESVTPPAGRSEVLGAQVPKDRELSRSEIALSLWLLGALLVAARFVAARVRLAKLLRRCDAVPDLILAPGASRPRVRILESDGVKVPFATGLFRPVVVLPRGASNWPASRLSYVLRHEIGHVVRHDGWWQALAEVVATLHWFNPLAWMSLRALRSEREHACDDLVISSGARASEYAHELLQIAAQADAVADCAAAFAMARRSQLEGRLLAVLDPTLRRSYSRVAVTAMVALVAILTVSIAALHAVAKPRYVVATSQTISAAPAVQEQQQSTPPQTTATPLPGKQSKAADKKDHAVTTEPADERGYIEDVSLPALPAMPAMPALPAMPAMPAMAPNTPTPAMPAMPAMPTMPAMPAMPTMSLGDNQYRFSTAPSNLPAATSPSEAFLCFDRSSDKASNNTSISNSGSRHSLRMTISGNGCSIDLRAEGMLTFNSNASGLESIEQGGFLEVNERVNGDTRRADVEPQSDGTLKYTYTVNGSAQPWQPEGQRWFSALLLGLDRRNGFAAAARVPVLLRQGGPNAVLNEIRKLSGDYARSRYYVILLREAKLDNEQLNRVLQQAGSDIKSDYEKSRVLVTVTNSYDLTDERAQTAFVQAIGNMSSDYERARVLVSLFNHNRISSAAVALALGNISTIKSDYERARVLTAMAQHKLLDAKTQDAYFRAIGAMTSDYERSRAYVAGLSASTLDDNGVVRLLQSLTTMKSDYEIARVMLYVANRYKLQGALRDQYLQTAQAIRSTSERQRALYAAGMRPAAL